MGNVMDVDGDGKAIGTFLRVRVAIEIDKPLYRGVFSLVYANRSCKLVAHTLAKPQMTTGWVSANRLRCIAKALFSSP